MRQIDDRNILDKFCEEFCKIVEKHTKYIIVSGFLVIASGRTRGTEDIDMIIKKLNQEEFKVLFDDLIKNGFVCMQSSQPDVIYEYLQNNTSVRFTWKDKPLPEMEVKFVKDLLDEHQINTRIKIPLTGLDIWFSNININIAFKEELLKSPKDMEDAKHLRIVFAEDVNEGEIYTIKEMIKKLRL
ncbi:hypothetical protein COV12_00560 [Candidatus Woesearchaeota archaeon CG10_big_fil_rev_8_21_14_0_10_32_24]|nr:MAG: hypothetical protein COV12_00560 [Candidatus Woesearchaeota archaeon CG10_big_fil_rev_8_21_14_0_10_32_24]